MTVDNTLMEATVVKSNDLIYNMKSKLALNEQKVVFYYLSQISQIDPCFKTITVSLDEFCAPTDFDCCNLKEVIKQLASQSINIQENGKIIRMPLFQAISYEQKSELVEMRLADSLKPYFLGLTDSFTTLPLKSILALRSSTSLRLYELLKAKVKLKNITFTIDELSELIDDDEDLGDDQDLDDGTVVMSSREILAFAVDDINQHTDLTISYAYTEPDIICFNIK
ncbi:MAG: replication initiation protein [Acetobacterium sp.]